MSSWPPAEVEIETQKWNVSDLQDGDLVFGQRSGGPFAALCAAADEPWMHVGSLTTDENGHRVVVELRLHQLFLTDVDVFFSQARYQTFGAARLRLRRECIAAANTWMKAQLKGERIGEQSAYPWDDYLLAGVIAAGHRGLITKCPDGVRAALAAAARWAKEAPDAALGELSLTCSAYMQVAYDLAEGPCVIEHPRWRSEPMSWPNRSPFIDELFEMSEEELVGYDDVRLVDILLDHERQDRGGIGDLRKNVADASIILKGPRTDQWLEMLKVVVAAIGGFALGTAPLPGELVVDSRWVTPGDLWRSPTLLERAYVAVD